MVSMETRRMSLQTDASLPLCVLTICTVDLCVLRALSHISVEQENLMLIICNVSTRTYNDPFTGEASAISDVVSSLIICHFRVSSHFIGNKGNNCT